MSEPMKVLFAGTPEPAAVTLEYLLRDSRLEVVGVLTQPDAKRGRGRSLRPSKVAELAEENGLPVHKWPSLKSGSDCDSEVRETLQGYASEGVTAVAVVAYGNLIPGDLLNTFEHGWINLHFSKLPRWRGAAPVQAAIAEGDDFTGASTFRIEEGLDTGPVIDTLDHQIGVCDTADDLLTELTYAGRELLAQSLVSLDAGTAELQAQDDSLATHAAKIASADARIDWNASATQIQRVARAHTPAPGAWTLLGDQRYKVGLMMPLDSAGFSDDAPALAPGALAEWHGQIVVGTGSEELLSIERIQPPGKKMMDAADWARGQQALLESQPQFEAPEQQESEPKEGI